MSISFGSIFICFLISLILLLYLIIILEWHIDFYNICKPIFVGIIIIFVRMLLPVNFPFSITIPVQHIIPHITSFLYIYIGDYTVFDIVLLIWLIGSIIKLSIMSSKDFKFYTFLKQSSQTGQTTNETIAAFKKNHENSKLKILITPLKISPSITGLFRPILILPDYIFSLSEKEINYIITHEFCHYSNLNLLLKHLIKIFSCIYWWNPIIFSLQKRLDLMMELTTDTAVIKKMTRSQKISYAQCLITVCKLCNFQDNELNFFQSSGIPFLHSETELSVRIKKIVDSIDNTSHRLHIFKFINVSISIIMCLICIFFIPEAYSISAEAENTSFSISSENAYLIEQENGYELYVDDEYVTTLPELDDSLKDLKIYKDVKKNEKE